MLQKPEHLLAANAAFILILGLVNGGIIMINLQLEYSLPLFPILFFSSAISSMVFWMYCAHRLRINIEDHKKAAFLAATPWLALSIPTLIATTILGIIASNSTKAIGWGLITLLLLVSGALCWVIHMLIMKPKFKK